jgi:hypothetical protein
MHPPLLRAEVDLLQVVAVAQGTSACGEQCLASPMLLGQDEDAEPFLPFLVQQTK